MRRSVARLATFVAAAGLVASACAGAASTPSSGAASAAPSAAAPSAADPVTLTFWHTYNEQSPENETLGTLITAFEGAHPGVKVEALSVPYEDFRTKLIAAIAAGTAPDLIRSDIIWVPELADMGALVALDQEMPDFAELKQAMYPGPLSTNEWKGHYYGLPLDTNTKVWLYNDQLYAAAGATAAPATLDALEGLCAKLKQAKPDSYLFATDGTFAWVTLPWVWSFGGDVLDAGMTKATGTVNGAQTVAAYEYLLKLYDQGCISPVILGDGVDPYSGFGQGTYASLDNGPWSYPIMGGQFPDAKFSAAPFPAGTAGSIEVVGGEDVNVFVQSKHKSEALEFARYLVSPEYQLGMAAVGQIPVRHDLDLSALLTKQPYLQVFLDQLKTARARPPHPKWSDVDQILTDAGQLILRHEKSPQAALDEAAAKIDALVAK